MYVPLYPGSACPPGLSKLACSLAMASWLPALVLPLVRHTYAVHGLRAKNVQDQSRFVFPWGLWAKWAVQHGLKACQTMLRV